MASSTIIKGRLLPQKGGVGMNTSISQILVNLLSGVILLIIEYYFLKDNNENK